MVLIVRSPLSKRERPIASDVALAIYKLVGGVETALPIAITKAQVVEQLVEMAHTDEDGNINVPIPAARRALMRDWINLLSNTSTFQSGYKHFEANAAYGNFPVVPATDYFFSIVWADGSVADALNGMSEFEIQQSLPKRRGRVKAEDGRAEEFLRNADGEVITFGELAGIVVFPRKSDCLLLDRWYRQLSSLTLGQAARTAASISYGHPNRAAVGRLEAAVDGLKPTLNRALPKPKEPEIK